MWSQLRGERVAGDESPNVLSSTSFSRPCCIEDHFSLFPLVVVLCNKLELPAPVSGTGDVSQQIYSWPQTCACQRDAFDLYSSQRPSLRMVRAQASVC